MVQNEGVNLLSPMSGKTLEDMDNFRAVETQYLGRAWSAVYKYRSLSYVLQYWSTRQVQKGLWQRWVVR